MKKNCDTCKHCNGDWPCDYCGMCHAGDDHPTKWEPSEYYEPDTNADRIRNMSDEELADFLLKLVYSQDTPWSIPFARKFCDNCPTIEAKIEGYGKIMKFNQCDFVGEECPHGRDIMWWLREPAEEDENGK